MTEGINRFSGPVNLTRLRVSGHFFGRVNLGEFSGSITLNCDKFLFEKTFAGARDSFSDESKSPESIFGVKSGFSSSENDSFEILYLVSVDDLALREWGPYLTKHAIMTPFFFF
jgi:hypothetical protein